MVFLLLILMVHNLLGPMEEFGSGLIEVSLILSGLIIIPLHDSLICPVFDQITVLYFSSVGSCQDVLFLLDSSTFGNHTKNF